MEAISADNHLEAQGCARERGELLRFPGRQGAEEHGEVLALGVDLLDREILDPVRAQRARPEGRHVAYSSRELGDGAVELVEHQWCHACDPQHQRLTDIYIFKVQRTTQALPFGTLP